MQIIIHRGTHQIGGIATEIRSATTRILIDMGDELSLEKDFISAPLSIPGVTDSDGNCAAVLLTHYHRDHVGQLENIRDGIPLYMGPLAKDVLLATLPKTSLSLKHRIEQAKTFDPGNGFRVGDFFIIPFSADHSTCDSYMFLIECDGKRILYTGDFRLHGFRGKGILKFLDRLIDKIDALIIEGTTLSRTDAQPMTERKLQKKVMGYMEQYKYVFVLCATTNLERICAMSKAVPRGKYFICDEYQSKLLELVELHWSGYSSLYRNIKKTTYGENLLPLFRERGFLMTVRNNENFRKIIHQFPPEESIILYSMWDGYRTVPENTISDFLNLVRQWEPLHTSGHASPKDIQTVIEKIKPDIIIPIHTDNPEMLQTICPDRKVVILNDGETFTV